MVRQLGEGYEMVAIPNNHPLKLLFTGLVEHAFYTDLGICDPELADYVSTLLVTFTHVDNTTIVRDCNGRPAAEIGEMIEKWTSGEEPADDVDDRRFVHRQIGDYALFWTGVYPEQMKRHIGTSWRDRAIEYVSFGKRSYAIASELTPPNERPPSALLRRLSDEFEFCVYGLGLVRRELQHPTTTNGDSPDLIY